MASTSAFGWETPDDTDLVKDGAAAIRTLGNSIDTSMSELKGGTTGQVLSKTSNTDMDFTWVAQDDSNAIQNAIVDAKGDLIAASANDTPARLAVGNNGETLVADSSTSTGLRYTPGTVQSNAVLNSSFEVFQRGTSISVGAARSYTADRWSAWRGGFAAGATVSQQTTSDTTNLPFIKYCARVQRDSGNTSTQPLRFAQDFESINSNQYAGKTVTVSFYARKGANYSVAASDLRVELLSGTGTDQALVNGYTGQTSVVDTYSTITTTWTRFTVSGTAPTNCNQVGLVFTTGAPVGTAGAADYFEVTGVQIDFGSTALPYRPYAATIQGELAACQRYYQRFDAATAEPLSANGGSLTTTISQVEVVFPVQLRTAPSSLDSSNVAILNYANNTGYSGGTLAINLSTKSAMQLRYTHGSAVFTAGSVVHFRSDSGTGYLGWSAEL